MTNFAKIRKEINRDQVLPLATKRLLREAFNLLDDSIQFVESFVTANYDANQLISGGAAWVSALTFAVSPCRFVIDGQLYSSQAANITLSAADATHPRIDVIAVNKDGTVSVVEGTAAASPVKPELDPELQVEVTFATIAALATTPSNVGNTDIYKEDAEWTSAVVGNVAADDTSDPYAGTKAIKFTAADNGDRVLLTAAAPISPAELDRIMFQIKFVEQSLSTRNRLRAALYNGTTRVSGWLNLSHGLYGIDGAYTAGYQFIHIPFGNFRATGTEFDTLRIQVAAASGQTLTCLLDNIEYQIGAPNTDTTDFAVLTRYNAFTTAQGSPIKQLTDGATITVDLKEANVFEVVIDGNRTIDFTNPTPGQHFTLFVVQDDTVGSRTLTWDAVNDWAGGTAPTLSTAVDAVDVLTFAVDSSGNIHGSLGVADSK